MLAVTWKRRGTGAHGGLSTFVVALAVIALVVLAQPTVHAQDSGLFRLVTFSVGGEARLGTTSLLVNRTVTLIAPNGFQSKAILIDRGESLGRSGSGHFLPIDSARCLA